MSDFLKIMHNSKFLSKLSIQTIFMTLISRFVPKYLIRDSNHVFLFDFFLINTVKIKKPKINPTTNPIPIPANPFQPP